MLVEQGAHPAACSRTSAPRLARERSGDPAGSGVVEAGAELVGERDGQVVDPRCRRGTRTRCAARRAGRRRHRGGRRPRTAPSRRPAPRPAGGGRGRTARGSRRTTDPSSARTGATTQPSPASWRAAAVASAERSRAKGVGRRLVVVVTARPQVVGGGEPPRPVGRVDPPVVAAEADRGVLDRLDVQVPAPDEGSGDLGVGEVVGAREHPATLASRAQRWRCTRVRIGTRGPV